MESKKVRLENDLYEAFLSIYKDIDQLASLVHTSNRLPKKEAEIFKVKSHLKQSVKAIEFLTTEPHN
ncbi:hypothetical protein IM538_09555 [Cytobacillus suaedae]|nr:hypothetical protein IM538_09555 [Cytobacillus suaedae]